MATHIFRKARTMLANLRRMIFGISGDGDTAAGRMVSRLQRLNDTPQYLPESAVPAGGIDGVAVDGSTWMPWRVSSIDGEQWYARTSRHGEESQTIHGDSPASEIRGEADMGDVADFDFDDDDERTAEEILADFRRDVQLVKARHQRGELVDTDDEFGGTNDE